MRAGNGAIDLDDKVVLYTRDVLPSHPKYWQEFAKKTPSRMTRIDGPFYVETDEGTVFCPDGWLALDARGYPYPIADSEHKLIYQRLETEHGSDSI